MASHGVSRHDRYERLLRKHRLDTWSNDGQQKSVLDGHVAVPEQKATRSNILHDERVVMREKRQQAESPSTTVVTTDPQITSAHNPESIPTFIDSESLSQTTAQTITVPTTLDQQTAELPSATESKGEPIAVTTTVSEVATAATTDESTTGLPAEVSTVTTTDAVTESATATPWKSWLSESAGIVVGISASDTETSTPTKELLPISTSPSTPIPSLSTSIPIISQPSESSSDSPVSLGSSLDIPTAVILVQTTPSTSAMVAAILSGGSSTSSSNTSSTISTTTNSTTTSIPTSSTSTSTSSTSHSTTTSYSDSSYPSGYGWGEENGTDTTTRGAISSSTNSPDSGSGSSSDSDSGSGSGSDSGTLSPETTGKIVGGVVGGVAGASVIFLLIILLLRRRRKSGFFFGSPARLRGDDGSGGLIPEGSTRQMVSRDSDKDTMFGAQYLAPAFMKRWRQSQQSTGNDSIMSSASSERGFQKISGRKLPTGIHPEMEYSSGGLEAGSPTESDISYTLPPVIPRSSVSSQPPTSNPFSHPLDASFTREVAEDTAVVMRPSPARTPTSGVANVMTLAEASVRTMPLSFPMPPSGTAMAIPKRPDALGRSHPSFDGSRGSRFTESL